MGRRAIKVEVVFFYVLTMVPFTIREPEQALLENGVIPVPERQGKAESLLIVGDPRQTVLAPTIRTRTGLVMTEVVPGVAALAVVFAYGPPLPFTEVRPHFFQGTPSLPGFIQPHLFNGFVRCS